MQEYPKIETLFERKEDFTVSDVLKHPVLGTISSWTVTEKVDGTNIRVHLDAANAMSIGGRTANAQINGDLVKHLYATFNPDKLAGLRKDPDPVSITLYGEGYGAGIQKGAAYRPDKGFILFDVLIDGRWWLDDDAVTGIAAKLGIQRVPILGKGWDIGTIVEYVRTGQKSVVGEGRCPMEGVVARPISTLFDARGRRIILKLKTRDYTGEHE